MSSKDQMDDKDLNNLARLVKKVGQYKPEERPHQPKNQPSKKELSQTYVLNLQTLEFKVKE